MIAFSFLDSVGVFLAFLAVRQDEKCGSFQGICKL